jgi:hypothetical protein
MAVKRAPHLANLLALAFLVTACSQTSYVDKNVGRQDAGALNPFDREVEYQFDLGLLTDRPSCIAVGSVEVANGVQPDRRRVNSVHLALVAHARSVLPDIAIVEIDLDPSAAIMESSIRGCPYVLLAELIAEDDVYLLVWSRKRFGLRASLVRVEDKEELWSARHIASRSEGDVPLDPVGAVVTIFRTGDFAEDNDVDLSLIDDAVRRTFATLPMSSTK